MPKRTCPAGPDEEEEGRDSVGLTCQEGEARTQAPMQTSPSRDSEPQKSRQHAGSSPCGAMGQTVALRELQIHSLRASRTWSTFWGLAGTEDQRSDPCPQE